MGIFFELDGCCCCFNLRTGTSILLWFSTVLSGIASLMLVGFLAIADWRDSAWSAVVYSTVLAAFVYLVMFEFIPNLLGLYAVFARKPSYLRIYVIVSLYKLASLLASAIVLVLLYITRSDLLEQLIQHETSAGIDGSVGLFVCGKIFSILLTGLVQLYFTSVVHNYYLKLKAEVSSYESGYVIPPAK